MNSLFNKLIQRSGAYSRHYLINIYNKDKSIDMHFVNNISDITYNGYTYTAGAFNYTPNASELGFDGGGSLEIAIQDTSIVDLIETNTNIYLDVIACLQENGTISELKSFAHHYGSVSGNRKTVTFTFEKDDRLDMTFPTMIFSTLNNRGNS